MLVVDNLQCLLLMLCMLDNFSCFCCCLLAFFKINLFKKFFQEHYIRVSKGLDSEQDRLCISPDLGPNCLQRLL